MKATANWTPWLAMIVILTSAVGCDDEPASKPNGGKVSNGAFAPDDIRRNFNFNEGFEAGWHVAVWTGGQAYGPSSEVTFYVEVTPPADFEGKQVLEVVVSSPGIGGGRESHTFTEAKEFTREYVSCTYRVRIKNAFLSGSDEGAKPLNLGIHKVTVKVRTDPGPTFTFNNMAVHVVLMKY